MAKHSCYSRNPCCMLCASEIIIEKKGMQGTLSQIIVKVSHQTFAGMIHTQLCVIILIL